MNVKEQIEKIPKEDMEKIHQMQYLNRILSAGCSPVAPTSVTVVIDDSSGNIYFKRMMSGIRQNMTWAKCVQYNILRMADSVSNPLIQGPVSPDDSVLIIYDSKPLVMTSYLKNRFCDIDGVYMNIGNILESALNGSSAELCFETDPMTVRVTEVPRHIVVLTGSADMGFITAVHSPELECSVRVIDLRDMDCVDILDSVSVLGDLFKDPLRNSIRDDHILFTDWRPPTYWEFIRSEAIDETSR